MAERTGAVIGGHEVQLTNLDKAVYPEAGFTKGDVVRYYAQVAPAMLPLVSGRPATRKRWVHGTGAEAFFEKNLGAGTPGWVARRALQHQDHTSAYPLVDDLATLVWLSQLAALEIHVPQWRFPDDVPAGPGRAAEPSAYLPGSGLLHPDRLVFDLDPGEGTGLPECAEVARLLRADMDDAGHELVPLTSGSKGIHLYTRLDGTLTPDEATDLAHDVAEALRARHPGLVVTNIRTKQRAGRVLIDWSQNRAGKTTVAPYSLRGRDRPWVAAPRTWDEIVAGDLRQLTAPEVCERLAAGLDPAAPLAAGRAAPPDLADASPLLRAIGRTWAQTGVR